MNRNTNNPTSINRYMRRIKRENLTIGVIFMVGVLYFLFISDMLFKNPLIIRSIINPPYLTAKNSGKIALIP